MQTLVYIGLVLAGICLIAALIARFLSWRRRKMLREMEVTTRRCGHTTHMLGSLTIDGEEVEITLQSNAFGVDWCLSCLQDMIIPCGWCGKDIVPHEPITLYIPRLTYTPPDGAMAYTASGETLDWSKTSKSNPTKKDAALVGCLRMGCADSGADRAGFWHPPGHVRRVRSPLEQVMDTGQAVIVEDLSDQNEATSL